MFITKLLSYIKGYLSILVEGYFIEKFINICANKGIKVWNINRQNSSIMTVDINIFNFKKIRNIAKTTKCRVKIMKKRGLPFIFQKYKKRKFFAIMLIFFIGIIVFLSTFIWNIEFIGESEVSKEEVLKIAKEYGLDIGTWKPSLNYHEVESEIRLKRDDIAWVGVTIKGTNAIIEIVDKIQKPELIDETDYCNIISDKDAIITKVVIKEGKAIVKPNDIVTKGDLLAVGIIESEVSETRYVHTEADIEARVWYSERVKVYLNQTIAIRTGVKKNKNNIKINKFRIKLFFNKVNFENYDKITTSNKLKIFSNIYLPLELITDKYFELTYQNVTYTIEEAISIATMEAENLLNKKIPENANIMNKQTNVFHKEDYIEAELIYESLENIGTKEKINF
jgi:sporulation protein YqfD